jgi:calcineurin-like phosphoesterase family protein
MSKWFISDTHFGHANIIKYSQRPFKDVDEMNEMMIQEWNKLVKPEDEVYHNGDFAFMTYDKFRVLSWRLNGRIYLQLGNHDSMIIQHRTDLLKQGKIVSIENYRELKTAGNPMIVLFHYGQRVWNKSHHGSIHLYGHSHGSLPPHGLSVDAGVDCKEITSEYRPVHLDEVLAYMSKRKQAVVDHHGLTEEQGSDDGSR